MDLLKNQEATVYVGNLDDKVTESILWELFVQIGPVIAVNIPRDRITATQTGYGFIEFLTPEDADYASKIMTGVKLYGKAIKVNKAVQDKNNVNTNNIPDIGANLFIGNLDPQVDEKILYDTFSAFGLLLHNPKIARDPETGTSKGYAFISYATFEAADAAIESMFGQYICNQTITIDYALKQDGKGDKHGSEAERLLAAQSAKLKAAGVKPK